MWGAISINKVYDCPAACAAQVECLSYYGVRSALFAAELPLCCFAWLDIRQRVACMVMQTHSLSLVHQMLPHAAVSCLSLACLCGIPSNWVLGQSGDRDFLQIIHAVAIPWCSAMFRSKIMCQQTLHVSPHAQGHTQRRAESDHITRLNNRRLDICFVLSTGCWQCSFCPWQVLPARQHACA